MDFAFLLDIVEIQNLVRVHPPLGRTALSVEAI